MSNMEDLVSAINALVAMMADQQAAPKAAYKAFAESRTWDGNKDTFRNWWVRLVTWVNCQPGLNRKQKTATALLRLTGRAADYARVQLAHYNELEGNQDIGEDPDRVWPEWRTVKRDLENHFRIDVLKEEAYKKLASFQQGRLLIEVFTQQFDILQLDSGVDDSYTLHVYKENIDYNIYFQLSMRDPPIAETLNEWKKHAIIVGKTFN